MNPKNTVGSSPAITIVVINAGLNIGASSLNNFLLAENQRCTLINWGVVTKEILVRLRQRIQSSDLTVIFSTGTDEDIVKILGISITDGRYWIGISDGYVDSGADGTNGTFVRKIGYFYLSRRLSDRQYLLDTFCNLDQYRR